MTRTGTTALTLSDEIRERFDEFSRSQKDVARYIVDHLEEAAFQTAEELARRADTSSSTVVRFSQALGFEGYPELQQAAIEEYRAAVAASGAASNGAAVWRALTSGETSTSSNFSCSNASARRAACRWPRSVRGGFTTFRPSRIHSGSP